MLNRGNKAKSTTCRMVLARSLLQSHLALSAVVSHIWNLGGASKQKPPNESFSRALQERPKHSTIEHTDTAQAGSKCSFYFSSSSQESRKKLNLFIYLYIGRKQLVGEIWSLFGSPPRFFGEYRFWSRLVVVKRTKRRSFACFRCWIWLSAFQVDSIGGWQICLDLLSKQTTFWWSLSRVVLEQEVENALSIERFVVHLLLN